MQCCASTRGFGEVGQKEVDTRRMRPGSMQGNRGTLGLWGWLLRRLPVSAAFQGPRSPFAATGGPDSTYIGGQGGEDHPHNPRRTNLSLPAHLSEDAGLSVKVTRTVRGQDCSPQELMQANGSDLWAPTRHPTRTQKHRSGVQASRRAALRAP